MFLLFLTIGYWTVGAVWSPWWAPLWGMMVLSGVFCVLLIGAWEPENPAQRELRLEQLNYYIDRYRYVENLEQQMEDRQAKGLSGVPENIGSRHIPQEVKIALP